MADAVRNGEQCQAWRGNIGMATEQVLETLVVVIEGQTKDLEKATKTTNTELAKMQKVAGKVALGITAAMATGAAAIWGVAKTTTDAASKISDSSKKIGMTAEEYQKWTYAAQQSGIEVEKLEGLMKRQQTTFADATAGSKIAAQAYEDLGIDIKGLTAGDAFNAVIAKLAETTDITERNRIANDLFGKSYSDLAPLLAEGATGIDLLRQEAVDLGGVMSNEAVASGDKFGDTLDSIDTLVKGLFADIGEALIPVFQDMADWILDNKENIKKFATDTIQAVVNTIKWFVDNKDTVKIAIGAIATAFLLLSGPLTAVLAAIVAIGAIAINWDSMDPGAKVLAALGGIAIAAAAAAIAVGALQSAWSLGLAAVAIVGGVLAITAAINSATKKTPANTPVGGHFARGGFPNTGSLFVAGESGAELIGKHQGKTTVMPLENTNFVGAMKQAMIEGLSAASQGGSQIVIQVDGMTLAKSVEKNLNKLSTQQGGLNIAL